MSALPAPSPSAPPVTDAATIPPATALAPWEARLQRRANGTPIASVGNAYIAISLHPDWRGVIAYDLHAQRVVKRVPPPYALGRAGDWDGMDDSFTAFWLSTHVGLETLSSMQAAEAVEMAARDAAFDPVVEHLDGLAWDGTPRLDHWLVDYFGAPSGDYTRLVGRWWVLGMVKRAFEPGCKFDFMPILEGPQGRGKSTALEVLAHPWFGNTDFVVGDKDSLAVIQGKWLYEIAELDSFNKADTTRVKSFVSRQVDEFRPAYGRRVVRLPRRVVFVGTTNQFEYFKDASGNRRFWPIRCLDMIDLEGLAEARDQLFAEAVMRLRAGDRCYPTLEEQELLLSPEQQGREIVDSWEDAVHRYLEDVDIDGRRRDQVGVFDLLVGALRLDAGKITKEMTMRVAAVMRQLGWTSHDRRGEHPRYVYERPQQGAGETGAPQADHDGAVLTAPNLPNLGAKVRKDNPLNRQ